MGEETAVADESLSDILSNDAPAESVTTEPAAEPSTGEPAEQATEVVEADPTPEPAESEAEASATPAPEKKDEPWHISAVMDERDKRQKAEKALAAIQEQHKEPTEPTSVFTDESKFREEITQNVDNRLTNATLNQSEFFASREYGKDVLAAKVETFKQLATDNPNLAQRFSAAISPYHELVDIVDQHEKLAKMENIDETFAEMKAKAKAEALAEIASEQSAGEEAGAKKREAITPSLAGERSTGGTQASGDESLDSILANGR